MKHLIVYRAGADFQGFSSCKSEIISFTRDLALIQQHPERCISSSRAIPASICDRETSAISRVERKKMSHL